MAIPPEGKHLPKHTDPPPQRDDEIYCPGDEIWRDRIKADLAAQLEAGGTLYGYRDDGAYVATTKHGDRIISRPPKGAESRRSV